MTELDPAKQPCSLCDEACDIDVLFWTSAFIIWDRSGDKTYIIEGLKYQRPIPPWARVRIAGIIEGTEKRNIPKNQPHKHFNRNLFIRSLYKDIIKIAKKNKKQICLGGKQSPADYAINWLADCYGLSSETIRSTVRRKKV